MTRLSVALPTLRRVDTLEHTLATVLRQDYDDMEIVVQNNGNDRATRKLVQSAGDPRVRHFSSKGVLTMTENWELAAENSSGAYLTFIGDDDALLPDACAIAGEVLEGDPSEILSWEPLVYFWPQFFDSARQNRLQAAISFDFVLRTQLSRPALQRVYQFKSHYSKLPMIYNSFISRSLVERVRRQHGRYFFGSSPDVTSGIVNASASNTFLKSSRPLSIAGLSHHSIGHRYSQADELPPREELERDFPDLAQNEDAVGNLEASIATDMAYVKQMLLADAGDVELDHRGLVRSVAAAINNSPARYERTLELVGVLTERFGIDLDTIHIPPNTGRPAPWPIGVHVLGPREVLFVIDGNVAGLRTIADAAGLASQLVPGPGQLVVDDAIPTSAPPVLLDLPLSFSKRGLGATGLIEGWAEPEGWGTWSIDNVSTMRIRLGAAPGPDPIRLGLRYRTIVLPQSEPQIVRCTIGTRLLHEWRLSESTYKGELTIEIPPDELKGDFVELALATPNAKAPADVGVGMDPRPLGIGVEQIRLLP
jgi:glycosyltransferase involved in cell wall biosynthesis